MKQVLNNTTQWLAIFTCMLLTNNVFSQAHVTMSMKNITATTNTIEYDLYIVNDGNTALKLSACSYGINYDEAILNNGDLHASYVHNSRGAALEGLSSFSVATKKTTEINQIKMTTTPSKMESATDLLFKTPVKIGRFRITNSVDWTKNSDPAFMLQEQTKIGFTTTQVLAYLENNTKLIAMTPALKTVTTEVEKSPLLNPDDSYQQALSGQNGNSVTQKPGEENSNSMKAISSDEGIMTLYPNPAINNLYVEVKHPVNSKALFRMIDYLGHVVVQEQVELMEGNNKITFEVGELSSGIYFIKVQDEHGIRYSQRFTKQ